MAELWFIGLGLWDERDLSRRALAELRGCAEVFAEEYTSRLRAGSLERLGEEIGRPIVRLDRAALESEAPIREALGRGGPVALLVVGDPFVATTHVALRRAMEREGHHWRYRPNASVLSAVPGWLGLMPYRFGRTVSVPFPAPGYAPRSFLDQIGMNRSIGLHTLVLLDLEPAPGRALTAHEALAILTERDRTEPPVLPAELPIAVAARIGAPDARAWYAPRTELARVEFGPPPHALVVPAPELHEEESAAIERYRPNGPDASPLVRA